jgi:serine/threonine protein kinase
VAIRNGQRLGPYEVLSAIGAGGMGEVYRARDSRLERTVAIKVLPTHLADKPELRGRFEREARTIASLNHPHICTLYDIGHQDEIDYLVLEYLEGEALAERLKKGPLPLDQVLQYAIQIADALDSYDHPGLGVPPFTQNEDLGNGDWSDFEFEPHGCQLIYISSSERNLLAQILKTLNGWAILTVGEMEQFAARGGKIQLTVEDKQIHFTINLSVASGEQLRIRSNLLSLARVVGTEADRGSEAGLVP